MVSTVQRAYYGFTDPQDLQTRIFNFDSLGEAPVQLSEEPVSAHRPNAELYDWKESDCQIRFDYHPASKRPSRTFSSYEESIEGNAWSGDRELPAKPYAPFSTFADFDFAKFVTEHRLSSSVINDLLKQLHTTWASQVLVTLETADETEQHVKMSIELKLVVLVCLHAYRSPLTPSYFSPRRLMAHPRTKVLVEIPCMKNTSSLYAPFRTGFPPLSRIQFSSHISSGTQLKSTILSETKKSNLLTSLGVDKIGGKIR